MITKTQKSDGQGLKLMGNESETDKSRQIHVDQINDDEYMIEGLQIVEKKTTGQNKKTAVAKLNKWGEEEELVMFAKDLKKEARDLKKEATLDKWRTKPVVASTTEQPKTTQPTTTGATWTSTGDKKPEVLNAWKQKPVVANETKEATPVPEPIADGKANQKFTGKIKIDSQQNILSKEEEELRLQKIKDLESVNEKKEVKPSGKFANSKLSGEKNSLMAQAKTAKPIQEETKTVVTENAKKKKSEENDESKVKSKAADVKPVKTTTNKAEPQTAQPATNKVSKIAKWSDL
jgi:hypothetical protein